jgi:hypothetical protein
VPSRRGNSYLDSDPTNRTAYSGPSLPLIPRQSCHPFHSKAAPDSADRRSLNPRGFRQMVWQLEIWMILNTSISTHRFKARRRTSQARRRVCARMSARYRPANQSRSLHRECLDFFIPITESHLRWITKNWPVHYNAGRPHSSMGPGIPAPPPDLPAAPQVRRHCVPNHFRTVIRHILGGLHHEYGLLPSAA